MSVEPVDRRVENMPDANRAFYNSALIRAQTEFYRENYRDSIPLFEEAHRLVVESQTVIHQGLHKGDTFYFLGVAELGNNQRQESLWHTLLAYVEDTLGTPFDFEDNADRTPAGRLLIDGFSIQLRLLREIKRFSKTLKENRTDWLNCGDPEPILLQATAALDVERDHILSLCERQGIALGPVPLGFPQPRERRVFLGTNYDSFAHVIPEMRLAVISRNYTPVASRDVVMPQGDNPRGVSLVLLHTCRYAFIDITNPMGQIFELERAGDYGVNVFLLRSRPVGHEAYVSGMINSLPYPILTYADMGELRQIIINHLP